MKNIAKHCAVAALLSSQVTACRKQPQSEPLPVSHAPVSPPHENRAVLTQAPSEPREAVAKELKEIWPAPQKNRLSKAVWSKILAQYWPSSFDAPLPNVLNTNGQIDPKLLGNLIPRPGTRLEHVPFSQQFEKGEFDGVSDPLEVKALTAFYGVASADAVIDGHALPILVEQLAATVTPRRGDVQMFRLLDDAYDSVESPQPLSGAEFDEWRKIAHVPNPLYRLLGLRRFGVIEGDSTRAIEFYREYIGETDPAIVGEVIRLAMATSGNERLDLLEAMRLANVGKSPPETILKLEQAKTDLETLLRAQGRIK